MMTDSVNPNKYVLNLFITLHYIYDVAVVFLDELKLSTLYLNKELRNIVYLNIWHMNRKYCIQ